MKKIISLVLITCLICTIICACGSSKPSDATEKPNETSAATEVKTEESATEESATEESTIEAIETANFSEQDKVLVDSDMIKITLNDEVEESYYVGYNITIENKSNQYILLGINNASVDGFMTYMYLQNSTIAPGKKAKTDMQIFTDQSEAKTLDDLKNIEGSFSISTNSDGGNSYTSTDIFYPFSIDGRSGSDTATSTKTEDNLILVDNEYFRVAVGDKVEDSNSVGYQITIENKSDYYILVGLDNTSVDGFMTYLYLDLSTIAPHKIAKTVMKAYTSNSDIKTLDDLKNVEGAFTVATNSDGSSSYTHVSDQWPFAISEDGIADNSQANNTTSSGSSLSAEEIDAMLQGTWALGEGVFSFDNGSVSIIGQGSTLSGTYTINTAESVIDADIPVSDGTVTISIPYEINDGTLTIKNNQGENLIKQ